MPSLADYLALFIEMLPLFVVMDLIPIFIASLIENYVNKKCYLSSNSSSVKPHFIISYSLFPSKKISMPTIGLRDIYITGIFVVLVAPFVEEIIFRGVPLLMEPTGFLAWIGTIGWALAHPIAAITTIETCKSARKYAILNAIVLSLAYISVGTFHMFIWLRGFAYGVVAIAYHAFHNFIYFTSVVIENLLQKKKMKKILEQRRRVEQPVAPIEPAPVARRVLRYVGLENSVVASEPEEAKKVVKSISIAKKYRRILRST